MEVKLPELIAVVGVITSAAGTVAQIAGQSEAASASRRAEELRRKQMDLQATRERRNALREAIARQAEIESAGVAANASYGSSVAGAVGGVSGALASRQQGINVGQEIGAGIFDANAQAASGQSMSMFGSGLSSLGGTIINNAATIKRIGTALANPNR